MVYTHSDQSEIDVFLFDMAGKSSHATSFPLMRASLDTGGTFDITTVHSPQAQSPFLFSWSSKSPVPLPFRKALTIFEGKSDVGIADNAASNRGTCVAWPLWPLTGFVNRRCYKDLISMVISCTGLKWGQAIWQSGKVILRFWNVLARSDSEVRISRARKC